VGVLLAELHDCIRNPVNYDVSLSFSHLERDSRKNELEPMCYRSRLLSEIDILD
jgi:hypothetical protein